MKKRFTDKEKLQILQQALTSDSVRGVCRQHGITEQTFYRWRNRHQAEKAVDFERLQALKKDNEELKKLIGELTLDNRMLRELNERFKEKK